MEVLFILGLLCFVFWVVFFFYQIIRLFLKMHFFMNASDEEWNQGEGC